MYWGGFWSGGDGSLGLTAYETGWIDGGWGFLLVGCSSFGGLSDCGVESEESDLWGWRNGEVGIERRRRESWEMGFGEK